jgi:hypothetical protein
LAGAEEVGDFGLGVAEGLSFLREQGGQGEVELDVLDVFVGEVEEVSCRAELPAFGFESAALFRICTSAWGGTTTCLATGTQRSVRSAKTSARLACSFCRA